jgi:signal transduction histidine kinase
MRIMSSTQVFLSLFVAMTVWICHEDGLLSRPDALLYRWGQGLTHLGQQPPSLVLLVEMSPTQLPLQEATILPRLLGTLEQLGTQTVVFNFLPASVPPAFYQEAVRSGNVFFGRGLVLATDEQEAMTLAPLPTAAEGLPIQWGIVQLPPTIHGLARSQFRTFRLGGAQYPALETAVAAQHQAGILPFTKDTYLVNFRGGPGSLPRINAERILAGELVPELVAGRTVLIGAGADDLTPGVYTPTSGAQFMSVLEYQGHALDTLLTGRVFSEAGRWVTLFLFFCVAGGSLVVYEWPALRSLLGRMLIPFVACIGLALVALFLLRLWLPLAGLFFVQILTTLVSASYRAIIANRALDTIVFLLSASLRDRLRSTTALATDPWAQVVSMLQQTLDLKRMVFLDRIEGHHHVREVYTFNCSFADIDEQRRDYRRAPYSTALAARAPIRLDSAERHYLKTTEAETASEDQYMVPLIFRDHLYGFWAFGVDRTKAATIRGFTEVITAYSEQIGKLFHLRQQAEQEQQSTGWRWRARLFKQQPREESYKALDHIVNRMEGRLTQLETLLRDLHTATMVYDLLGAPLEVNLRMHELLKDEAIAPHELTIVEFIARLTHKDVDSARQALRNAVIEGHELALPVMLSKDREYYVLNVRPLRLREGSELREGPTPFGVSGIVCELVDRTSLTRLYEIKTQVVDRLATQLRTDLATIELSSSLLADGSLPEEDRTQMMDVIQGKVQQSLDLLSECQQYLTSDVYLETVETFPVNVQNVLAEVVETLRPQAEERGIRWEINQPQLMSAVFASPIKIEQVLSVILAILLRDTADRTAIGVKAVENENGIVYVFSNSGFGMPNDHFQEYLSGNGHGAAEELKSFREAIAWVKEWGGTLEAESHVGEGTRATLQLRRFI